jgi:hypothetical protein
MFVLFLLHWTHSFSLVFGLSCQAHDDSMSLVLLLTSPVAIHAHFGLFLSVSFHLASLASLWYSSLCPLCLMRCSGLDSNSHFLGSTIRGHFSYSLFAFLPLVPTAFHTLSRLLCTHGSLASTLSSFGHPFFDLLMSVVLL